MPHVPKLFQPSVACPDCKYANDESFNFCQNCGFKRQNFVETQCTLQPLRFPLDEEAIESRINDLVQARDRTPYVRQKSSLEREFGCFLANLSPPKNIVSCSPKEVIKFLVWKDKGGRTKVHKTNCSFLGQSRKTDCDCPSRLAHGTIDAMIGKLRSIFAENERVGVWDPALLVGNPASALGVKRYLTSVRAEQLQARVTPKQAPPFLFPHLVKLSKFIHAKLRDPQLQPHLIFMYARDQAYFKALFFSGDRGADLSQVKTAEILRFPDNSGLLFNHLWTKSLRNGDANVFAFKRGDDCSTCPVTGIETYIKVADAIGITVSRGFLFKALTKEGKVSRDPFSAAAARMRLKEYCRVLSSEGSEQQFTLHSFRSGAAVSLALLDVPIHDIMDHIGWKSSRQAIHYLKMRQVVNPAGPAARLSNITPENAESFSRVNTLEGFAPAFA